MAPPRSLNRKLTDLLEHYEGDTATAAAALHLAPHRLARLIRTPHAVKFAELNAINDHHARLVDNPPDAGDLNDLPPDPLDQRKNASCPSPSPDPSQTNKPSTPSKTEGSPTNNE